MVLNDATAPRYIPSRTVFLSSTTSDLAQYRELAGQVIDALNDEFKGIFHLLKSSMFDEVQSGERMNAVETSSGWVREAHWFVLIVGWHYGHVPSYGSDVPPEEQYSVTEWEYREAAILSRPPKTCFVFLAGDRKDRPANLEYRVDPKEAEDLSKFLAEQEHPSMVLNFRSTLRSAPHRLFRNIDHFRDELKRTLRKRIEDERANPPAPDPGLGPILELLELRPTVLDCIASVKTLAALKRIHDGLHHIRQFAIKRWRDELLNLWQAGAPASGDVRAMYFQQLAFVEGIIGLMRGLLHGLGQDWCVRLVAVKRVLDHFNKSENKVENGRQAFEKSIDLFSKRVEAAFSDTDWKMKQSADELKALHHQMITKGRVAAGSTKLTVSDRALFQDELTQSLALHVQLQDALALHTEWQRMHESLQLVGNELGRQSDDMALAPMEDHLDPIVELATRADGLWNDSTRPAGAIGLAAMIEAHSDKLRNAANASTYLALRTVFDSMFFEVDTETRKIVEQSEARAIALEQELRKREGNAG